MRQPINHQPITQVEIAMKNDSTQRILLNENRKYRHRRPC